MVEVEEEEYKAPTQEDLMDMKIWVHEWSGILNEGRRTHHKPEPTETMDDEAIELMMKQKRLDDPYPQRLAQICSDQAPMGLGMAWNMKHYGDMSLYPIESKTMMPYDCHGCTVLESLVWPGWKMAIYVPPLN